jgi:CheY-like chemotaxis protein
VSTATVLVVDDEPLVLELARRALARSGYDVLAARSASEALEFFKQNRPIHLLLSDIVMPGMSGLELLHFVRRLSPSTAAVLMSGYLSAGQIDQDVAFVFKPFSLPALLGTVSRALQSSPALSA